MSGSLTVELVNDTGLADSDVFLLLTGSSPSSSVSGKIQYLPLPQSNTGSIAAGALSSIANTGTSIVSAYTGNTCKVYAFEVTAMNSGRLLVSFDTPISYADNAAPTATGETMRWDKMEFGFPASGADLTSLDFFGIPMQFDYISATGTVVATRTFYTSTQTLLSTLYNLDTATMSAAFQFNNGGTASFGWNPSTDSLSSFLRVIGPQTLTAASASGSPKPYPSFASYLASLANNGTYTVSGSAGVGAPAPVPNGVAYDYSGSFTGDITSGFTLTLAGTMTTLPGSAGCYGIYTDANNNTTAMQLTTKLSVTLELGLTDLNNTIYSASATSFTVVDLPADQLDYVSNSPYANIAGDLIAGLNFGYLNGLYGANSAAWYSNPPTPCPFGGARAASDGFYNPYAAVFYNLSDSYGFPFSDRGGRPSPYVPLPENVSTMRVTILSDDRIDAPQVSLSVTEPTPGTSLFTLTWPAPFVPPGVTLTGYSLAVTPPWPAWVTAIPPDTLTTTVGALPAGMQYTFTLTALGAAANGNPVRSVATAVTGASNGAATQLNGDIAFQVGLNWDEATAQPAGTTYIIDTQSYTPGSANITVNGTNGVNVFPLSVLNQGSVIYQGNYVISLTGSAASYNLTSGGYFMLDGNSAPLRAASYQPPPYSPANPVNVLVVGTPFAPNPGKQASPVSFP